MDIETLLTGTKWEIVKLLSKSSSSPLEIAKKLNTTIANISQQIRLLETAGIIHKQKTTERKAGKPRTLFSLSDDYCFIILFSRGFAEKKLIRLNEKQKEVAKQMLK